MAKTKKSKNVTVVKSHRAANIAVIIVASIAALILIAIAVLSLVRVDPVKDLKRPERYDFYDLGSSTPEGAADATSQSKIRTALSDMDFTVMSAILQGHWDYSFNFKRNSSDNKITLTADELKNIKATSTEYMVELIYSPIKYDSEKGALDYSNAQSIKVDGETVYFDRVKILIGDTAGAVGTVSLYPYVYARLDNQSDVEGVSSASYKVTGINVRADTTSAYAALKDLAKLLD